MYFCDTVGDADALRVFFGTLPLSQRHEIDSLPQHRCVEKLAGRMLLSRAAADFGVRDIRLSVGEYGKPYLIGNAFHFNISHSNGRVVLLASHRPVGVDIELLRDFDIAVARKFATADEKEYILSAPSPEERLRRFFIIWTLKEAFIKADGGGFHIPMTSVAFTVSDDENGAPIVSCTDSRYAFSLTENDGFIIAAAEIKEGDGDA